MEYLQIAYDLLAIMIGLEALSIVVYWAYRTRVIGGLLLRGFHEKSELTEVADLRSFLGGVGDRIEFAEYPSLLKKYS